MVNLISDVYVRYELGIRNVVFARHSMGGRKILLIEAVRNEPVNAQFPSHIDPQTDIQDCDQLHRHARNSLERHPHNELIAERTEAELQLLLRRVQRIDSPSADEAVRKNNLILNIRETLRLVDNVSIHIDNDDQAVSIMRFNNSMNMHASSPMPPRPPSDIQNNTEHNAANQGAVGHQASSIQNVAQPSTHASSSAGFLPPSQQQNNGNNNNEDSNNSNLQPIQPIMSPIQRGQLAPNQNASQPIHGNVNFASGIIPPNTRRVIPAGDLFNQLHSLLGQIETSMTEGNANQSLNSTRTVASSNPQPRFRENYTERSEEATPTRRRDPQIFKWNVKFTGDDGASASDFILRVKDLASSRNATEMEVLTALSELLDGSALKWLRIKNLQNPFRSFDEFTKIFLAEFQPFQMSENRLELIKKRFQHEGEKIVNYFAFMQNEFLSLTHIPSESAQLRIIRRLLLPRFIQAIALTNFGSIEELKFACQKIETSDHLISDQQLFRSDNEGSKSRYSRSDAFFSGQSTSGRRDNSRSRERTHWSYGNNDNRNYNDFNGQNNYRSNSGNRSYGNYRYNRTNYESQSDVNNISNRPPYENRQSFDYRPEAFNRSNSFSRDNRPDVNNRPSNPFRENRSNFDHRTDNNNQSSFRNGPGTSNFRDNGYWRGNSNWRNSSSDNYGERRAYSPPPRSNSRDRNVTFSEIPETNKRSYRSPSPYGRSQGNYNGAPSTSPRPSPNLNQGSKN